VTSLGQALGAPRTYVRLMVDAESDQGDERDES
jgi:hypothetical protein